MIDLVKEELKNHIGDNIIIKYNLGRNRIEEYNVTIKELYNNVFIVENEDVLKSFSYSDIITKIISIEYSKEETFGNN